MWSLSWCPPTRLSTWWWSGAPQISSCPNVSLVWRLEFPNIRPGMTRRFTNTGLSVWGVLHVLLEITKDRWPRLKWILFDYERLGKFWLVWLVFGFEHSASCARYCMRPLWNYQAQVGKVELHIGARNQQVILKSRSTSANRSVSGTSFLPGATLNRRTQFFEDRFETLLNSMDWRFE